MTGCHVLRIGLLVSVCVSLLSSSMRGAPASPAESSEPAALTASPKLKMSPEEQREYYELLGTFVDALDQIDRNYSKTLSRRELMEAAIEGMFSKLDEHSGYIPPEEVEDFRRGVTSEFGGIGIHIGLDDRDRLTIISPLVGTPAYRAGLISGDVIVSVNGTSVRTMKRKLQDAVKLMKGRPGTEVTLTVLHPDRDERETVSLMREVIHIETVLGSKRNEDDSWNFLLDGENGIGYIRVTTFSNRTAEDVHAALEHLKSQDMRALILDLRFNPGGLFSSAVAISDMFLPSGLIVTTDGRNVRKESWNATSEGTFVGFPVAVLINRYSASGSEIVAASLKDNDRAIVVGERSFGKGSVQQVVDLEGGRSALKLTTGSYHRPNGKNIHRFPDAKDEDDWGVHPNNGFEVKLSELEIGRLFRKGQQQTLLRKEVADKSNEQTDSDDAESQSKFVDRQLDKALQHLREKLSETEKEKPTAGQQKAG